MSTTAVGDKDRRGRGSSFQQNRLSGNLSEVDSSEQNFEESLNSSSFLFSRGLRLNQFTTHPPI